MTRRRNTAAARPERRTWVARQAGADPGARFSDAAASLAVRHQGGIADICRLTLGAPGDVSPADAARTLLRAALLDCRRAGDLKIVIDLPLRLDEVITQCARHRFNYAGSRMRNGRVTHEFFADLYSKDA